MHRLFVALRPPPAIRAALIDLMGGISGARWQDDAQLHVTLRYIGEVERQVAEDAALALGAIHAPPVTIRLAGVGQFADPKRGAGAVWAGVDPREAITALHHKVDRALVRAGLSSERRAYLPHVTLARLPRSAAPADRFLIDRTTFATDPFSMNHILLYESHLSPDGATYEPVARYPLLG